MASEDDIARLLPEPPPPRPARREASIAEALRRFDGAEPTPPAAAPRPSRWKGLGRPQLGVLVSAALIALIGAPAAWISLHDRFPAPAAPAATNATEAVAVADAAAPATSPSPASPAALAQSSSAALRSAPSRAAAPQPASSDKAVAVSEADLAPPAPPPPPPAMKLAQPALAPAPPPPAPAGIIAPAAPAAEAQRDEASNIVVTGSRVRRSAFAARADGDMRSAGDDLDSVIATFDQAVARDPHNSSAWLNRGLARQRKGDLRGALDDLNRAIRLAPEAPAGYRARAQLERQRGDTHRAAADERRAADLESDR